MAARTQQNLGLSRDGLDVQGLDRAIRRLDRMGANAVHATQVMEAAGEVVLKEQGRRFGKGWKPDAPATVERKGSREVGVQSGRLKLSVTRRGAQWNIFEASTDSLKFGTQAPHAHLFALGRKGQPKRKLLRVFKPARRVIAGMVSEWIVNSK